MGKRKTARKPQKRVKQILAKKFLCIYCSHDDTVVVKLDMSNKIGTLVCGSCHVSYQTQIHSLAEPVDVYSAWIDSAEEAQRAENERKLAARTTGRGHTTRLNDVDDDDDEIDDQDHDDHDRSRLDDHNHNDTEGYDQGGGRRKRAADSEQDDDDDIDRQLSQRRKLTSRSRQVSPSASPEPPRKKIHRGGGNDTPPPTTIDALFGDSDSEAEGRQLNDEDDE